VASCVNTVTTVTVESTGHVVGTPGSQTALELEAQDAMNSTYVVSMPCGGNALVTFSVGNFNVTVGVGMTGALNVYMDVRLASTNQRFCATDAPIALFDSAGNTACNYPMYDCVGVSGDAIFGVTSFCGGASASYTVTLS
jgi:hypothetical protein